MTTRSLPRHPKAGVRALGWRNPRSGENPDTVFPIWPILGGAEDDDQGDGDDDGLDDDDGTQDGDDDDDEPGDGDPDGSDQLGDAGKRALDSMKGKWRSERDKRRALEQQLAERDAPKGDGGDQPDADEIRRQAAREATSRANTRILKSEIRAAAAGKLADPKDALRFLDLDQFEVDENGDVDADEIDDAITDLVNNKPYLAATAKRFQGTGDGGAARKASRPKQLTREDIKRMSPEQIEKAQSEGRLEDLLSGK